MLEVRDWKLEVRNDFDWQPLSSNLQSLISKPMTGHRQERVSERIREEIALMLEREVQDPRLANINVTRVEVSGDLRLAKVFVSARESENESSEMMDALARATRYFRRRLAENMDLRLTPDLRFQLDYSIERGDHVLRVLEQVQAEQRQRIETSQRIETNKRMKRRSRK
jgi:ribosome-binding factor A